MESAGAISFVCLEIKPGFTFITSILNPVSKPGIDSSLSMVPPVWANPLPASIGTVAPHARSAGARIMLILSPTPPVECLSTAVGFRGSDSPLSSMDVVKWYVSSEFSPLI